MKALAEGTTPSNQPSNPVNIGTLLKPDTDICVFWGMGDYSDSLVRQSEKKGIPWYHVNNSYFLPTRETYFLISKNNYHLSRDRIDMVDADRFNSFDLTLKPWREGKYIIITLQSDEYFRLRGINKYQWVKSIKKECRKYALDKPIIVRDKPAINRRTLLPKNSNIEPLSQLLRSAHALVCLTSNSTVDALLMGVPIFCLDNEAAAAQFGVSQRLKNIGNPDRIYRNNFLCCLANNQFTEDEMRGGYVAKQLGWR